MKALLLSLLLCGGCATLSRDTARAVVVSVAAVRTTAEAIESADTIVQPACTTSLCLDEWRSKRDKALRALSEILTQLESLTKGAARE